jgi:hypothetical protein
MRSGNAGEAAVLNSLVQRGFDVLLPFGEGHPFDLVVHESGAFFRIQCKTGWNERGCVVFNAYSTDHGRGQLPYVGRADLFGVFYPTEGRVYLVPVHAVPRTNGRLRLVPTRNNQALRVTWARDYEIDTWSPERLRGAVSGSAASAARGVA